MDGNSCLIDPRQLDFIPNLKAGAIVDIFVNEYKCDGMLLLTSTFNRIMILVRERI